MRFEFQAVQVLFWDSAYLASSSRSWIGTDEVPTLPSIAELHAA